MMCFGTDITGATLSFFEDNKKLLFNHLEANEVIEQASGIKSFFNSQVEASELLEKIVIDESLVSEPNRREYGDYQTNIGLASEVLKYVSSKFSDVEFILEPTCGRGNFILAAIRQFIGIKEIFGVEIYLPYVWETKFRILNYFLQNSSSSKPSINIVHGNVFDFPFLELASRTLHYKTLVLGNPPWVTNSELGSITSRNLPKKFNFKKHNGLDAITGKGNFDIGEYISLMMLKAFQYHNGIFAFLIKNSVAKNLISDQTRNHFAIGYSEMLSIDATKEFNVSVNASLFLTHFNTDADYVCNEGDFYTKKHLTTFGWYKQKLVYSVADYDQTAVIDGKSPVIWRSGVKHDCSKVMELDMVNNHYMNGLGEEVKLENTLLFGLLKSSDLKVDQIDLPRKFTIITQNKVGQETDYIKDTLPLTYSYLSSHIDLFKKRKSTIYKDKPEFSIFGIGDYSFARYKVAISGLYKTTHFSLVLPFNSKPLMLDDTCYFIGFTELRFAQIAHFLLNSDLVQKFLRSITFSDAKRPITKDSLMRIDLQKVYELIDFEDEKLKIFNLNFQDWDEFGKLFQLNKKLQIELF